MFGARIYAVAVMIAALLAITEGCGKRAVKVPAPARIGSTETGVASWYGVPYDGRRASSGEIYDMRKLTAAHRTLPFDTWVEVTNLQNGKTVDVRINDRGPFVGGRIIDLSMAAADRIDMVRSGTARVRLKVITRPEQEPEPGGYSVQAGAFAERGRAESFSHSLKYSETRVVRTESGPPLWRVLLGRKLTRAAAEELVNQLKASGNEAMVVKDLD